MSPRPSWSREGRDWPHRQASRFVEAGGVRWHVQVMGDGAPDKPVVWLLHGSGSASHSWRDIAPRLASRFTLVVPDLPGHGFSSLPRSAGLSLDGMAASLRALAIALALPPWAVVGHSAGGALAIRMRLNGQIGEGGVVAINGALRPFPGSAGVLFPALARLIFLNPAAIGFFAWRAGSAGAVARLLAGTGSHLDAQGLELYSRLLSSPGHIEGALGMMSHWNLEPLVAALPELEGPLTLIAAANDKAVPVEVSRQTAARVPGARLVEVSALGHLAHEEDPARLADLILDALDAALACKAPVAV